MEGEPKRSGWKIWLYLTPVYIILAVPLYKWTMRVNSGDVKLSKDEYGAFNSDEGDIKKAPAGDYDPGLNDSGYSVRYRSGKEGPEESLAGEEPAQEQERAADAAPAKNAAARPKAPAGQYRAQSAAQSELTSKDTTNKSYMSFGSQKGYLLGAVGKMMGSPKAVSALMNNSWVVKGFMGRSTTQAALGSTQGLKNYLSNPQNVNNFINNPVVQSAMGNPAIVNAFASSGMANAILASPAVQGMLQDPQSVQQLVTQNPQMMQVLTNPNVMNALMNNPQTAGLAGALGGAGMPGQPQQRR